MSEIDAWLEEGLKHYALSDPARALEAWFKVLDADAQNARALEYISYVRKNYRVDVQHPALAPIKDAPAPSPVTDAAAGAVEPAASAPATSTAASVEEGEDVASGVAVDVDAPPSPPLATPATFDPPMTPHNDAEAMPPPTHAGSTGEWKVTEPGAHRGHPQAHPVDAGPVAPVEVQQPAVEAEHAVNEAVVDLGEVGSAEPAPPAEPEPEPEPVVVVGAAAGPSWGDIVQASLDDQAPIEEPPEPAEASANTATPDVNSEATPAEAAAPDADFEPAQSPVDPLPIPDGGHAVEVPAQPAADASSEATAPTVEPRAEPALVEAEGVAEAAVTAQAPVAAAAAASMAEQDDATAEVELAPIDVAPSEDSPTPEDPVEVAEPTRADRIDTAADGDAPAPDAPITSAADDAAVDTAADSTPIFDAPSAADGVDEGEPLAAASTADAATDLLPAPDGAADAPAAEEGALQPQAEVAAVEVAPAEPAPAAEPAPPAAPERIGPSLDGWAAAIDGPDVDVDGLVSSPAEAADDTAAVDAANEALPPLEEPPKTPVDDDEGFVGLVGSAAGSAGPGSAEGAAIEVPEESGPTGAPVSFEPPAAAVPSTASAQAPASTGRPVEERLGAPIVASRYNTYDDLGDTKPAAVATVSSLSPPAEQPAPSTAAPPSSSAPESALAQPVPQSTAVSEDAGGASPWDEWAGESDAIDLDTNQAASTVFDKILSQEGEAPDAPETAQLPAQAAPAVAARSAELVAAAADPAPAAPVAPATEEQPLADELSGEDECETLMQGARELFALGDFSGSLELVEKVLSIDADNEEARSYLKRNEGTLLQMYESKLGDLEGRPRQITTPDEVIWMNLHHRAGFLLAQVDGLLSYEDLVAVSGMSRLETFRILAELKNQGVITT